MNKDKQKPNELPYQMILQKCLGSELRILNSHLPYEQKTLSELLGKECPHIICNDGSTHLFKTKELEYLASKLAANEQKKLLLPMIIEVNSGKGETEVICQGKIEEKVISNILESPVTTRHNRVIIYRPQLAVLRQALKTTTQYLFASGTEELLL